MIIEATLQRLTSVSKQVKKSSEKVAPMVSAGIIGKRVWVYTVIFIRRFWIFGVLALTVTVPQILFLWRPIIGVYGDITAIAILLIVGIYTIRARTLAISAAILPIASITVLCVPKTTAFNRVTVYYCAILFFSLMYRYLFSLDTPSKQESSLGKKYVFSIPSMVVIGELLGGLGYLFLRHQYMFQSASVVLVALASIVFAFAEEMLFQGLIQQLAGQIMNRKLAAALTVIAYTFATASYLTNLPMIFALLSGIVLATTYYIKQNLLLTTAVNALMKLTYIGLVATFILH